MSWRVAWRFLIWQREASWRGVVTPRRSGQLPPPPRVVRRLLMGRVWAAWVWGAVELAARARGRGSLPVSLCRPGRSHCAPSCFSAPCAWASRLLPATPPPPPLLRERRLLWGRGPSARSLHRVLASKSLQTTPALPSLTLSVTPPWAHGLPVDRSHRQPGLCEVDLGC